jgi:hypothetical protein
LQRGSNWMEFYVRAIVSEFSGFLFHCSHTTAVIEADGKITINMCKKLPLQKRACNLL